MSQGRFRPGPDPRRTRGLFRPGPDARRHTFTRAECAAGFRAQQIAYVRAGLHQMVVTRTAFQWAEESRHPADPDTCPQCGSQALWNEEEEA